MGLFSRPSIDDIVARVTSQDIDISLSRQYLFGVFRVQGFTGDYSQNFGLPWRTQLPEYLYRFLKVDGQANDRDWSVHNPTMISAEILAAGTVWTGMFKVATFDALPYHFSTALVSELQREGPPKWGFGHKLEYEPSAIGNGVYQLATEYQRRRVLKDLFSPSNSPTTPWERLGREEELYQAVAKKVIDKIQDQLLTQERARQVATGELNGTDHPKNAYQATQSKLNSFLERQQDLYTQELNTLLKEKGLRAKMLPKVAYEEIELPKNL